ncbi:MAG: hypothetical protein A3A32_02590 [Candidatus Wildermuthbacteria bacterium RIFCSPLOWO2_01_FULL_48_35]|uniref:Lipoprotein n=1 Tax=Candidatus Wildermuthbacteria bacterium RIFCSPLOWO2_01_FULL_48_35 TaxID=1802463 RepID=A0A1G2RTV3_9BACT|nr:MAG: hypothetical protein A3A32_02590 [Candidatus Wildermuthbacteria bacterium RIFCSPLOWO2_01_FULL_48_35]
MKTRIFLAALLAALILTACSPDTGSVVRIKDDAHGCQTWFQAALAWTDCQSVGKGLLGVVEDHPNLGHQFEGRIRVFTEKRVVLWFEPGDIKIVP